MGTQIRDISEATLHSMKDDELANWMQEKGKRVVCHRGRFWFKSNVGFYQPIHWMARMTVEEATKPHMLCWGYQATLCNADAVVANGTMPVHVLSDVNNYDMQTISSKRRNKIRNCRKRVRVVEILKPDLLLEQGYGVRVSTHKRTGYGGLPTTEEFRRGIEHYFNPRRGLIMGGFIEKRLVAYVIAFAVSGTVYIDSVQIATEALSTNVGTGMIFDLMQVCRRSGDVHEAIYGLETPEDKALCRYKMEMQFPVVHIPSRVWFLPFARYFIQKKNPYIYYRLTGNCKKKSETHQMGPTD